MAFVALVPGSGAVLIEVLSRLHMEESQGRPSAAPIRSQARMRGQRRCLYWRVPVPIMAISRRTSTTTTSTSRRTAKPPATNSSGATGSRGS